MSDPIVMIHGREIPLKRIHQPWYNGAMTMSWKDAYWIGTRTIVAIVGSSPEKAAKRIVATLVDSKGETLDIDSFSGIRFCSEPAPEGFNAVAKLRDDIEFDFILITAWAKAYPDVPQYPLVRIPA